VTIGPDITATKAELAEYNEELEGGSTRCEVCLDRKVASAFARCGHTSCAECAKKLFASKAKCPFCQARVEFVMPLYM
jgi:hypothetical protein